MWALKANKDILWQHCRLEPGPVTFVCLHFFADKMLANFDFVFFYRALSRRNGCHTGGLAGRGH